jgi:uncharacterized protein (DUF1697 family)
VSLHPRGTRGADPGYPARGTANGGSGSGQYGAGMPEHIAFLRAVNVGKRQVKMAALRGWLADAGFTDVETYIQTGNVKVSTPMRSQAKVQQRLEEVIAEQAGFEVPCIMFTPTELAKVHADALAIDPPAYAERDDAKRYVIFFKDAPTAADAAKVHEFSAETEQAWVKGRAIHVWIAGGMMNATIFPALEKIFAPGTNRNLTVVAALAERWC